MSDLISRQAVKEQACMFFGHEVIFANKIDLIPSADRPGGKWQRVNEQPYFRKHYHKVYCSVCHKQGSEKYNYCPNCGARMKGADNETD